MTDMTEGARRWFLIMWIVTLLGFSVMAGYLEHNARTAARTAHAACEQRRVNVQRANAFYVRMAALERENTFVNQRLRDARVAAYEGLVYDVPVC